MLKSHEFFLHVKVESPQKYYRSLQKRMTAAGCKYTCVGITCNSNLFKLTDSDAHLSLKMRWGKKFWKSEQIFLSQCCPSPTLFLSFCDFGFLDLLLKEQEEYEGEKLLKNFSCTQPQRTGGRKKHTLPSQVNLSDSSSSPEETWSIVSCKVFLRVEFFRLSFFFSLILSLVELRIWEAFVTN